MANYQQIARQDARRYGLDPNVFERQIRQESGFDPNVTSPAGAIGIAQIMPGTAKGWGVNPRDPVAALDAAARNMASYVKKYGGIRNALIAYNAGPGAVGGKLPAETQGYLNTILGKGGASSSPAAASPPADATASSSTPGTLASVDPGQSGDAAALLAALAAQQKPQIASGGLAPLAPPAATARPVLPNGFQQTASSSGGPAPAPDISSLLALAATPGLSGQATPGTPASGSDAGASLAPSGGSGGGISRHARPGDPVVSGKQSVGGVHETMGLAGFPAHDYFAPAGSHAVAPVSGTVVKLSGHDPKAGPTNGPHGPLGWSTYIKGSDGKTYFLTHMGSRNVQVGQTVKQGQIIGTVANYDRYGTPSHIHMGVSG